MAKLVRLKPLDRKKGHVIHRYTTFQTTFEESKGWYRVPDHVAAYLATVHQLADDEDSPLAFDVCTREEAQRIDAAEKKKAEERALAAEPNVAMARDVAGLGADLTTADLRDPNRRSRSTAAAGRRA
ncbi:MAG: hypothetical protein E6J90_39870 [Deltaproteobacteria bacterium]|nr:MAG: hypothetical protein E6J90_39870 [Deltaproteobacteria bacterium]TMQ13311.1 MAG: hypothetical protein E6J91_18820 [Deltaproteobacteria bacterium]